MTDRTPRPRTFDPVLAAPYDNHQSRPAEEAYSALAESVAMGVPLYPESSSTARPDDVEHAPEMIEAVEEAMADFRAPPIVILESPYAGDIERNVAYARACLWDSLERGEAPYASHLLYTQVGVLDDSDPAQRTRGMAAGFSFIPAAAKTVVYEDFGISLGMVEGVARAEKAGIPIEFRRLSDDTLGKIEADLVERRKVRARANRPFWKDPAFWIIFSASPLAGIATQLWLWN